MGDQYKINILSASIQVCLHIGNWDGGVVTKKTLWSFAFTVNKSTGLQL